LNAFDSIAAIMLEKGEDVPISHIQRQGSSAKCACSQAAVIEADVVALVRCGRMGDCRRSACKAEALDHLCIRQINEMCEPRAKTSLSVNALKVKNSRRDWDRSGSQ